MASLPGGEESAFAPSIKSLKEQRIVPVYRRAFKLLEIITRSKFFRLKSIIQWSWKITDLDYDNSCISGNLRWLKTYLRTILTQKRVTRMLILHIHKHLRDKLNSVDTAQKFISRLDRQWNQFPPSIICYFVYYIKVYRLPEKITQWRSWWICIHIIKKIFVQNSCTRIYVMLKEALHMYTI